MRKVAIAVDGDNVSAHFGRCPSYLFVEMEGNTIINKNLIQNPGHQRGSIPEFINEHGAKTIICGGMGHRAQQAFQEYGITPIMGIQGPVEDVLNQLKNDKLLSGESTCSPNSGRNYGIPRSDSDHKHEH